MPRQRWYAAAAFGVLNVGLFTVGSGGFGIILLVGAPPLALLLLVLAIVMAYWCLAAVDDLTAITSRDAAALLVRGSMAGALVGAIVGGLAFAVDDPMNGLFGAMLAGFVGLFAGLACAVLDVAVLAGVRLARPALGRS